MTHLNELISLCRHPKIQERRGKWQEGDMYYDTEDNVFGWAEYETAQYFNCEEPSNYIWLPPLSDPLRPERSLLGMLKGEINIERNKHTWCVIVDQREGTYGYYKDDSLEIAVCKAVIGQYES